MLLVVVSLGCVFQYLLFSFRFLLSSYFCGQLYLRKRLHFFSFWLLLPWSCHNKPWNTHAGAQRTAAVVDFGAWSLSRRRQGGARSALGVNQRPADYES